MEIDRVLDIKRGFEECQVVPDALLRTDCESQRMPLKENIIDDERSLSDFSRIICVQPLSP